MVLCKESVKVLVIGGSSMQEWAGSKAYVSSGRSLFRVEWAGGLEAGLNRLEHIPIDRVYVDPELIAGEGPQTLTAIRARSRKACVKMLPNRASRFTPRLLGLVL